jgi:phospholipase C
MSSPVRHVVIIVKENHAFDNYFGTFPGAEGAIMAHSKNPPAHDPDHRHRAWLTRAKTATREQFHETDIPDYFRFAREFTLCDHYFTDVAGPSTPNHLMLIAGDSPIIDNPSSKYRTGPTSPLFTLPSLPHALDQAKQSWANFGGYAFDMIHGLSGKNKFTPDQFKVAAAGGKLPAVSWVYAPHDASEHPADPQDAGHKLVGNVTHGMQWTVDQVKAVVAGGLWPSTTIFITWDDWGGWYDHVNPPQLETWKDSTQFRYGTRVPCLVLSPYARRGHISKTVRSHVSLLKFCIGVFGLTAWHKRVSAADDMGDCFDFRQSPGSPPS